MTLAVAGLQVVFESTGRAWGSLFLDEGPFS